MSLTSKFIFIFKLLLLKISDLIRSIKIDSLLKISLVLIPS